MRTARPLAAALATAAAVLVAGCGSSEEPPPVPEPAASPPLEQRPAGRLVKLGGAPEGVVADPETGLVAVALRNQPRLALVDGRRARVERMVDLPASARHLALARAGGPVLVPAEGANRLVTVKLPSGETAASTKVGRFPHDATAALGGRVWTADEFGDSVSVVEDGKVVKTLSAPSQPGGVAASQGLVGAVAVKARKFEAYDARALRSVGRIDAGVGPTHVVAHPDGRMFVVDTQGDAVLFYRLRPELRIYDRLNVPGTPFGISFDPKRDRLWVTQTALNTVKAYTIGRPPREVASYPTVRQPNTVSVDPSSGRVYVGGRDGRLQVIDPR